MSKCAEAVTLLGELFFGQNCISQHFNFTIQEK